MIKSKDELKLFPEFTFLHYSTNESKVIKVKHSEGIVSLFEWQDFNNQVLVTWIDYETGQRRESVEPQKGYSFLYRFLSVEENKGVVFICNPIKGSRFLKEFSKPITNYIYLDSKKKIENRVGFKLVYEGCRNEG